MNTTCNLTDKHCVPCEGGVPPLTEAEVAALKAELHADWVTDGVKLVRRIEVKGFAKPVYTANAAAYLGDKEGHHPDVAFGWGYCEVTFTTHAIGGLSENDFICAAKLDQIVSI
jgi:4a-hydroxytetrahydrobiopterin dehydratase